MPGRSTIRRVRIQPGQGIERILITGSGGMLGSKMRDVLGERYAVAAMRHGDLDICDPTMVKKVVGQVRPDVLINCAAFTRVDDCETDKRNAFSVNADGPRNLADACRSHDARLVHISTDYVFDGKGMVPYREDDPTGPINVYGRSKLEGEENIRRIMEDHIIVRTSWLFGENGPNFVDTILRLARERDELRVVNDQRGSPTYTGDLALAVKTLLERGASGTWHVANGGVCTWYEFASEIVRFAGMNTMVIPVSTAEFPRPAARPAWSVLDTGKYAAFTGAAPRPWQEALKQFVELKS